MTPRERSDILIVLVALLLASACCWLAIAAAGWAEAAWRFWTK